MGWRRVLQEISTVSPDAVVVLYEQTLDYSVFIAYCAERLLTRRVKVMRFKLALSKLTLSRAALDFKCCLYALDENCMPSFSRVLVRVLSDTVLYTNVTVELYVIQCSTTSQMQLLHVYKRVYKNTMPLLPLVFDSTKIVC